MKTAYWPFLFLGGLSLFQSPLKRLSDDLNKSALFMDVVTSSAALAEIAMDENSEEFFRDNVEIGLWRKKGMLPLLDEEMRGYLASLKQKTTDYCKLSSLAIRVRGNFEGIVAH